MSTLSVTYQSVLTVAETLAGNTPAISSPQVTHNLFNTSNTYNNSSTVAVSEVAAFTKALVAGAATIDLTALLGTNDRTINGTGLKVKMIKIKADVDNANPIVISEGASNGYELAGNAFSFSLSAGDEILIMKNNNAPAIGGSAKNVDLAGTGTQSVDVIVVMGA